MDKLSRSKIELCVECPRCFWLDMRLGVKRPPPAPYTINSSIDYLLKQEFDFHRQQGTPHRLMKEFGIDAVPYQSEYLQAWRHNFTGIQVKHPQTNFLVFGAVDDVWIDSKETLIVVDYKSTGAQEHKIYESYRRQIEVYQWLLKNNGYSVNSTGYFVFAKVNKTMGFGQGKLSFDFFVESVDGDCSWVDSALVNARKILSENIPQPGANCLYCRYVSASVMGKDSEEC